MTAFDTDVISDILNGREYYVERAEKIPTAELSLSVAVFEEVMRGRLNAIRQAESGKVKLTVVSAYEMLRKTVENLRHYNLLAFETQCELLLAEWKKRRIKVGIMDMRIAASCIVAGAKLVSRNRKDFDRIPGLNVEYWDEPKNNKGK
jgi:tRNA(fMet)-specific endonuclease VapC